MKFKNRINAALKKIRYWFLAVLASLGIIVGAYAVPQGFTWTNPTTNTDGSIFDPATDLLETRFYCDGDVIPTFVEPGNVETAIGNFAPGDHSCYATTVNLGGVESDPSNTSTFTVTWPKPNPPVLQTN